MVVWISAVLTTLKKKQPYPPLRWCTSEKDRPRPDPRTKARSATRPARQSPNKFSILGEEAAGQQGWEGVNVIFAVDQSRPGDSARLWHHHRPRGAYDRRLVWVGHDGQAVRSGVGPGGIGISSIRWRLSRAKTARVAPRTADRRPSPTARRQEVDSRERGRHRNHRYGRPSIPLKRVEAPSLCRTI